VGDARRAAGPFHFTFTPLGDYIYPLISYDILVRTTMCNHTTFEHIGAARLFGGSMRIDIKTMQAVIAKSDVDLLMDHSPVDIFDISDVIKAAGNPDPVGRAWITRSGRAVMYTINGMKYISPLAQVRGAVTGERKYANVSLLLEIAGTGPVLSSPTSSPAEVAA